MIADATLRRLGWSERAVEQWGDLVRGLLAAVALGTIAAFITIDSRILRHTITARHYSDFGLFYAQAALGARGADPYGPVVRPGRQTPDHGRNLNPPHFHLVMRPFVWFRPETAFTFWVTGWIVALTLSFALTYRALAIQFSASIASLTVMASLISAPTIAVLLSGQLSPLLALPMTWAWVQSRGGRWQRAAIALGAIASLKPFVALFLPYLLARRRWSAALAFIAALVLPWVAGVAVFGQVAVRSYVSMLASIHWSGNVLNGSLFGFWQRVAHGSTKPWELSPVISAEHLPVTLVWLLTSGPLVCVTLWTMRADERPPDVDRAFLLGTTGALLASPLGWSYYYWLFAGPFVAVAVAGWRLLPRTARALICAAVPGLLIPPAMLAAGQPSGIATVTIGSLYFWSLFAIWGAALLGRKAPP